MIHRAEASIPEYADTKDLLGDPARVSAHRVDEDRQCGLYACTSLSIFFLSH